MNGGTSTTVMHDKKDRKKRQNGVHTAVILQHYLISHPLPDLVHVLGQDVMHVLQVRSQELLLRFSRAFLVLTKRKQN